VPLRLSDQAPEFDAVEAEVLDGLRGEPKQLPCKLFYDERGSRLFDGITRLPEYYPTRVEVGILRSNAAEMAERLGRRCLLVELGSGSSVKTRILLDELVEPAAYVPVDISEEHLVASAERLRTRYPDLEVLPVSADYTREIEIPPTSLEAERRAVFFPGSTIGNFHRHEAVEFLRRIAELLAGDGALLVGVDLKKDPEILHRAYDDAQGLTARFNLNVLSRLNRELRADFDPARFRHRAVWNEAEGRVEMHLDSLADQVVRVSGAKIRFREGESIWTESSYKYTLDEFRSLAAGSGFAPGRVWTDEEGLFSVHLLTVEARSESLRSSVDPPGTLP